MKFKIQSDILQKALNRVYPAIPSKIASGNLDCFAIEMTKNSAIITASDGKIVLKSEIEVSADNKFNFLVEAKKFYETIRTLKESDLTFVLENINEENYLLKLKTISGEYEFQALSYDKYTELPSFEFSEESDKIIVEGSFIKRAIEKTLFAAAKDEIKLQLSGVNFDFREDSLNVVATDAHKLVRIKNLSVQSKEQKNFTLPEKSASILQKIVEDVPVEIIFWKSFLGFKFDNVEFYSRTLGEKYPNYNNVIPMENDNKLKINTSSILEVVKRMIIFSSESIFRIKFTLGEDKLILSTSDISTGAKAEESLPCEYSGEKFEIGFNAQFLFEILSRLTEYEEIIFNFYSPTKAVIIMPTEQKENEHLLMLLMPVRLTD